MRRDPLPVVSRSDLLSCTATLLPGFPDSPALLPCPSLAAKTHLWPNFTKSCSHHRPFRVLKDRYQHDAKHRAAKAAQPLSSNHDSLCDRQPQTKPPSTPGTNTPFPGSPWNSFSPFWKKYPKSKFTYNTLHLGIYLKHKYTKFKNKRNFIYLLFLFFLQK